METTPEWIKERATQFSRQNASRIRAEGPTFWNNIIARLRVDVDGLRLIEARGTVTVFAENAAGELVCRIDLFNNRGLRRPTDTGLFYRPGESEIRSLTNDGESLTYSFTISQKGELAVIPSDGYSARTAAEVADAIIQAMLDRTS